MDECLSIDARAYQISRASHNPTPQRAQQILRTAHVDGSACKSVLSTSYVGIKILSALSKDASRTVSVAQVLGFFMARVEDVRLLLGPRLLSTTYTKIIMLRGKKSLGPRTLRGGTLAALLRQS